MPTAAEPVPIVLPEKPARIVRSGADPLPVALPEGIVQSVTAAADGFCVLLNVPRPRDAPRRFRLATITDDGKVVAGPVFTIQERHAYPVFISSDPLRLATKEGLYAVQGDLTITPVRPLPQPELRCGQVGDRLWLVANPSDGKGGGWPVDGPDDPSSPDDRRWLFVLLDGDTLDPVTVLPLSTDDPYGAAQDDGTLWIAGNGALRAAPRDAVFNVLARATGGLLGQP
ncbi:hypothetical protein [Rhodococcus marinonascens]|uniref:hypothetical protein n=1 Tax=Rhodococcus marinonascens TaxID=38311 RepID=UPI0009325AAA|nr:hypothetical protein [Rhodococcus marinonascens]